MIYFGIDDNNCKRFEWDNNKMIKCNKGNEIITFKYDTRGSRTNKTIIKDNNKLIKEERSNGISLIYLNSDNDIIGFVYNNEYYIYHKNITGEIIVIIKNHHVVARYVYDAWGNSVYNNSTNPNYTTGEAFVASAMDAVYYRVTRKLKYQAGLAIGSFAINAGIAVGASIFIGALAMRGAGLVVRLSIAVGGLVAIGIGLAGAVVIYYIEEGLERLYGKFKEFIFE